MFCNRDVSLILFLDWQWSWVASDTGWCLDERVFRKLCCVRGGNDFSFVNRINRISRNKFHTKALVLNFECTFLSHLTCILTLSSVQFSRSVVSDSLWPHELQQARPPCTSPTTGVHSDSRPWSQWCHPAISSSVIPFSSCPQSLPESESFPMSQLFTWGGQGTGFQLQHHSFQRNPRADLLQNGLVGSPCSPRDSQASSPTHSSKA